MDLIDKVLLTICATVTIAALIALPFLQQKTIKITCGKNVSLYEAMFYDLDAAGCPTVTIKK